MIDWLYKIGSRYGRPIELVLLGDILELWETEPYYGDGTDPAQIRENAKAKIIKIMERHKAVFSKLYEFQNKGNRLVYVLGNHDDDIEDALVQRFFKNETRLTDKPLNLFRPFYTNRDFQLIARHGHEFDDFNRNIGFGKKPPGRLVTEQIVYHLEMYQAVQKSLKGESAIQVKGPFDKVDSVVSYLQYVKCLKAKGLVPPNLAAELRDKLDPVVEKKVGKIGSAVLNAFIRIFEGSDPLDQVEKLLELSQKIGGKREPTEGDVKTTLGGDYNCFVMGHTHTPFIRKIGNSNLWINSGNWQDSGKVDNASPGCFKEAAHRNVTVLYKIESLSGSQVRENLKGGKKVIARMFTFPDAALVGKGEYSLS